MKLEKVLLSIDTKEFSGDYLKGFSKRAMSRKYNISRQMIDKIVQLINLDKVVIYKNGDTPPLTIEILKNALKNFSSINSMAIKYNIEVADLKKLFKKYKIDGDFKNRKKIKDFDKYREEIENAFVNGKDVEEVRQMLFPNICSKSFYNYLNKNMKNFKDFIKIGTQKKRDKIFSFFKLY